jgi:hypothetical protein
VPVCCCWQFFLATCTYLKVKLSRYRPRQAIRVPGGWGSRISKKNRHRKVVRFSALCTGRLYSRKDTWYSFLLETESTPEPQCELSHWKNAVTPSEIEPATFQLVAQCLNQLRHRVPHIYLRTDSIPSPPTQRNLTHIHPYRLIAIADWHYIVNIKNIIIISYSIYLRCDSPIGIGIRFWLYDPGIESRWWQEFPQLSRPLLGPTQPPMQWVPASFPGSEESGTWR